MPVSLVFSPRVAVFPCPCVPMPALLVLSPQIPVSHASVTCALTECPCVPTFPYPHASVTHAVSIPMSPQSHLAMFSVLHPLTPSVGSNMESSLASSTGSGGSLPTVLPTLPGHAHLLNPTDGLLEPSPGKPEVLFSDLFPHTELSCPGCFHGLSQNEGPYGKPAYPAVSPVEAGD